MINTVLLDRRSIDRELPLVVEAVRSAAFIGLDCETHDDDRHPGLNKLMKVNEDTRKKAGNTRLIFDMRRTTVCGFSIYPEGSDRAWYVNLAHADVANRVPFHAVQPILDAKPANGFWLAHNAPFELTVFGNSLGYELQNILCTMQMSVTAFGDDNYDLDAFRVAGLEGLEFRAAELLRAALEYDAPDLDMDEESERRFGRKVEEIIGKITSKTADSKGSYNGYVYDMAYGHGLKELVYKFFGHRMDTFKDTIGINAHMGQMTGDDVVAYGAEDAYWVVPLFRHLMQYIATHSPNALSTFFEQENPMIHVFSNIWRGGMRVNTPAIEKKRDEERCNYAVLLRKLRAALKEFEFDADLNQSLANRQDWYAKNGPRYRSKILAWRDLPDHPDDFEECLRVSSPVGNAWGEERGRKGGDLSIMHYMPIRVIIYDLLKGKLQFEMGKLASDGEARGKLRDHLDEKGQAVIDIIASMASLEQRMKLYLTPYLLLTDPETDKLYPTVNSLLNTRRIAASTPNPMQLAKRGESTYVRGFFLGDAA